MLEPTIIRQTATLTEWDGKQGYATADNGKIYPLNINNMEGDIFGSLPEKGTRVELYLHQDERGETEFTECRVMPSFDNQGGYAFDPQTHVLVLYEKTAGRKFHADYHKAKRQYIVSIVLVACLGMVYAIGIYPNAIVLLLCIFHIVLDIVAWRKHFRQPESPENWLFTLNNQGLTFSLKIRGNGIRLRYLAWEDIRAVSLQKSFLLRRPYWQISCHSAKWDTPKMPLHTLSDSELEQANLLLKQYLANYPEVSLCL